MLGRSSNNSRFQFAAPAPLDTRSSGFPGLTSGNKPHAFPATHHYYRPELDVLRFAAFLLVYFGHALYVTTDSPQWFMGVKHLAGFGVPLFFALSAFLITELLTIEKRVTGTIDVPSFYQRRILRIWPLYFAFLGTGVVLSHLFVGSGISLAALAAYLLFMGNWFTATHGYLPLGLSPLWSISIEEQFYLLWPLIVRYSTRRVLGGTCVAAWIAGQATLAILCSRHGLINPTIWTNSVVHAQYFAIGAGLSVFFNGELPKITRHVRLLMVLFAFAIFAASNFFLNPIGTSGLDNYSSLTLTYPQYLLNGLCILLMLLGVLGATALEGWRTLQFLGKISYGLYMFHLPCLMYSMRIEASIGWTSFNLLPILGFPMAVGAAWISYEYFERPFLGLKQKIEIVRSRPA